LDFGGGAGSHYYTALVAFPKIHLDWTIVENKNLVSRLRKIDDIGFSVFESLSQLVSENKSFDLALLSSSVQYTENPLATLKEVISLNPEFIYITRTPLSDDEFEISLPQYSRLDENGPGTSNLKNGKKGIVYRMTAVSRKAFEDTLKDRYVIQLFIQEDTSSHKYKGKYLKHYGYFCVRKAHLS
jgi:putative methyltransferase (TIGR04325 family)